MTLDHKKPKPVLLKDYRKLDFSISKVDLFFDLYAEETLVDARFQIKRSSKSLNLASDLTLNGESLKLLGLQLNGRELPKGAYRLDETTLTIIAPPEEFELSVKTQIDPSNNTSLLGLYKSGGIFVTQNESQGFRRMTYYPDRPDVMAVFTTRIRADKKTCPVLLANGNLMSQKDLADGRHETAWHDPFPKPCYLFALVAGDLAETADVFTTRSGREVKLSIYVEKGNENRTRHAMESLKRAMKWDEDTFGLECDLDQYKIVAVNDFNSGAMENKGLNIFNSQYVLADPKTATDQNFMDIEGVIGHEYFHNWTGNRVTCRDWFQLTLKEGLTIFRDQEFSSDMGSRPVKRIQDVRVLRDYQFVEDSGPKQHPIRPESYIEINNFYTVTVYEKGAEVIRMIETLIGKDNFKKGITKYFELYDGQAVTTEDFVRAMELASGVNLDSLKPWYSQAGTPTLKIRSRYDSKNKEYELTIEILPPKYLRASFWQPALMPLKMGLLDSKGSEIPLKLKADSCLLREDTLWVSKPVHCFTFTDVREKPVVSLLRNFSAPVYLDYPFTGEELLFLAKNDKDAFNRFEAIQQLCLIELERIFKAVKDARSVSVSPELLSALGGLLSDKSLDSLFVSEVLRFPSMNRLAEVIDTCDFDALFQTREFFISSFAGQHRSILESCYKNLSKDRDYRLDQKSIGERSLKNLTLNYLMYCPKGEFAALAFEQFKNALNMTDQIGSLAALSQAECSERPEALRLFYDRWKGDKVVMNKWFAIQASSKLKTTLQRIRELEKDPAFNPKNPNNFRSLYGVFSQNLVLFHQPSGEGYQMVADKIIEIDRYNPSAAAHLAEAFKKFARLDAPRKSKMKPQLERILGVPGLSPNTYEIVDQTLRS